MVLSVNREKSEVTRSIELIERSNEALTHLGHARNLYYDVTNTAFGHYSPISYSENSVNGISQASG